MNVHTRSKILLKLVLIMMVEKTANSNALVASSSVVAVVNEGVGEVVFDSLVGSTVEVTMVLSVDVAGSVLGSPESVGVNCSLVAPALVVAVVTAAVVEDTVDEAVSGSVFVSSGSVVDGTIDKLIVPDSVVCFSVEVTVEVISGSVSVSPKAISGSLVVTSVEATVFTYTSDDIEVASDTVFSTSSSVVAGVTLTVVDGGVFEVSSGSRDVAGFSSVGIMIT